MATAFDDDIAAVYRHRLDRARALAASRLRRMARELDRLTRERGAESQATAQARVRRDHQVAVLEVLERRIALVAPRRS